MEQIYGSEFFQEIPEKNISRSKSMDINTVVLTSKKKLESIQHQNFKNRQRSVQSINTQVQTLYSQDKEIEEKREQLPIKSWQIEL
jgi:hypothetical protein